MSLRSHFFWHGTCYAIKAHRTVKATRSRKYRIDPNIDMMYAIQQCAERASTLITHKHSLPERRKLRETENSQTLMLGARGILKEVRTGALFFRF